LWATCWFVERRRMLRPEKSVFNRRSVTARRQNIALSFPPHERSRE